MAQRYAIQLTHLGGDYRSQGCRVLADSKVEARQKGIRKLFGPRAFWQPDGGLGVGYGQVFEDVTRSGESFSASSLTGRARLNVTNGWGG